MDWRANQNSELKLIYWGEVMANFKNFLIILIKPETNWPNHK